MGTRSPWTKNGDVDYTTDWRTWELSVYRAVCGVGYGWRAHRLPDTKVGSYKTGSIERFYDANGFKNAALALADLRSFATRMGWKLPKYLWELPPEEKPKEKNGDA